MGDPPSQLDDAEVLYWTVSARGGFYQMAGSDPPLVVAAMAVVCYGGIPFYLFKCDRNWQVVQDWDCGSVEEALELAAEHANGEPLEWRSKG